MLWEYKRIYFLNNIEAYGQVKKAFPDYEKYFSPEKSDLGKLRKEISLSLKTVLANSVNANNKNGGNLFGRKGEGRQPAGEKRQEWARKQ